MIALLQRVTKSRVVVGEKTVASGHQGLLALVAVEAKDTDIQVSKLSQKILNYRIFADEQDRMNKSVLDINGDVVLVPQFTLAADTSSGNRPSFAPAASPDVAKERFERFVSVTKQAYQSVQSGIFGGEMQVSLVNDGPVTFWLKV